MTAPPLAIYYGRWIQRKDAMVELISHLQEVRPEAKLNAKELQGTNRMPPHSQGNMIRRLALHGRVNGSKHRLSDRCPCRKLFTDPRSAPRSNSMLPKSRSRRQSLASTNMPSSCKPDRGHFVVLFNFHYYALHNSITVTENRPFKTYGPARFHLVIEISFETSAKIKL